MAEQKVTLVSLRLKRAELWQQGGGEAPLLNSFPLSLRRGG